MQNLKNIFVVLAVFLLTACAALSTELSGFQPRVSQTTPRMEIPGRPLLSDLTLSGKFLYFLTPSGDKVELKKRDVITQKEDLVRIFPYHHEILKFAIAADELHIAFMSKENDQFIVYITDLGGERLIKVGTAPATNRERHYDAENFVLKRVGLKHKFLFVPPSLGCGGEVLSYISRSGVGACGKNTEILPDEQLLIIDSRPGGGTTLASTDYESWEPQKIVDLPFDEVDIQNLELRDEKTLRVSTAKEYVDVQLKE